VGPPMCVTVKVAPALFVAVSAVIAAPLFWTVVCRSAKFVPSAGTDVPLTPVKLAPPGVAVWAVVLEPSVAIAAAPIENAVGPGVGVGQYSDVVQWIWQHAYRWLSHAAGRWLGTIRQPERLSAHVCESVQSQ